MTFWLILKHPHGCQNAIVEATQEEIDALMVMVKDGENEMTRLGDCYVTPCDIRHCFALPDGEKPR